MTRDFLQICRTSAIAPSRNRGVSIKPSIGWMPVIALHYRCSLRWTCACLLDRYFWVSLDPVNVAEGLFAIANILSFSRICFLLPAFQHLGPLQISLGRMMSVSVRVRFISPSNLSSTRTSANSSSSFWSCSVDSCLDWTISSGTTKKQSEVTSRSNHILKTMTNFRLRNPLARTYDPLWYLISLLFA